jgi:hypothetical protein
MSRTKIIVPRGIRFISDWKDYQEKYLYDYPHILDKQIPGCGYTEWCIRSKGLNVILCSPRRILLQNKTDQHQGEVLSVDVGKNINYKFQKYKELQAELEKWIDDCYSLKKPCKIIVTYESYYIVRKILENMGLLDIFQTVVDDFQDVFINPNLYRGNEIDSFIKSTLGVNSIVYVIQDSFEIIKNHILDIPELSNFPLYELDWEEKDSLPNPKILMSEDPKKEIVSLIEEYRDGKYPGSHLIVYLDNIDELLNLMIASNLSKSNTSIICDSTDYNTDKLISKLGNACTKTDGIIDNTITLCTKEVSTGIDLYTNDSTKLCILCDNLDIFYNISQDLYYISGRIRGKNNIWKNNNISAYVNKNMVYSRSNVDENIEISKDLCNSYLATPVSCRKNLYNHFNKLNMALDKNHQPYLIYNYPELKENVYWESSAIMVRESIKKIFGI